MKLPRMLLAAGLATLLAPAAALADSIVYLDGGNVWSASPDGAHKVQLTDGGTWHSPTQVDDGTIAAVEGTGPIVVMARDGRPIRTITTEMARSSNGGMFEARPTDCPSHPTARSRVLVLQLLVSAWLVLRRPALDVLHGRRPRRRRSRRTAISSASPIPSG